LGLVKKSFLVRGEREKNVSAPEKQLFLGRIFDFASRVHF
jgi:hypothetical protein